MSIFVENQEKTRKSGSNLFRKKERIILDLSKFYDDLDLQYDMMTILLQAISETRNNLKFQKLVLERRKQLEELTLIQFKKFQKMNFLRNYSERELFLIGKGSLALIKGCALDNLTGDDRKITKKVWINTMHAIFVSSKKKSI